MNIIYHNYTYITYYCICADRTPTPQAIGPRFVWRARNGPMFSRSKYTPIMNGVSFVVKNKWNREKNTEQGREEKNTFTFGTSYVVDGGVGGGRLHIVVVGHTAFYIYILCSSSDEF